MELMWMMVPPPLARMTSTARWLHHTADIRLRSITALHCSTVAASNEPAPPLPPTLFTRMSSVPNARTAASTAATAPVWVATSATTVATSAPAARSSFAAVSRASAPRALRHTRAPSRASAATVARPMPRLLPVTSAALPLSSSSMAPGSTSGHPGGNAARERPDGWPTPLPRVDGARGERLGGEPLDGVFPQRVAEALAEEAEVADGLAHLLRCHPAVLHLCVRVERQQVLHGGLGGDGVVREAVGPHGQVQGREGFTARLTALAEQVVRRHAPARPLLGHPRRQVLRRPSPPRQLAEGANQHGGEHAPVERHAQPLGEQLVVAGARRHVQQRGHFARVLRQPEQLPAHAVAHHQQAAPREALAHRGDGAREVLAPPVLHARAEAFEGVRTRTADASVVEGDGGEAPAREEGREA